MNSSDLTVTVTVACLDVVSEAALGSAVMRNVALSMHSGLSQSALDEHTHWYALVRMVMSLEPPVGGI